VLPRSILLILILLVLLVSIPEVSAQVQQLECKILTDEPTKYDWENWSYYQLLELKPPKNNKSTELDSKGIRKAYRKQAQIWHPDKHVKNNRNSSGDSKKKKNANTSMEECTARFAKIAEAYEVLSDPQKREEYDLFLKHCRGQDTSQKSKWSFRFEKFMDPMQVFEEFFFGSSSKQEQQQQPPEKESDDAFSNFFESSSSSSSESYQKNSKRQSQQQQQKHPVQSYRHEEYLQDPYTGEEIIRIMQTEEYAPIDSTTGKFFYRTQAQEFKKTFDPFTGMSYYPVSEPYILEEGYRYPSEKKNFQHQQQQQRSSRSKHQQRSSTTTKEGQTILYPGDVLTPRSTLLVSPNQRYYAGLSPECELLVMADNNGNGEDDVIWSSQLPKRMQSTRCFATLRGPHLVVGMERPGHSHQVLWFSEAEEEEDDLVDNDMLHAQQQHSTYLAQLDNDGSLVVYKVWNVPRRQKSYSLRERAWMEAANFVKGQTKADYDVLYSPFSVTYRKCVYATGPLGCFRVARRLYELSLTIYYTIKGFVTKVDNKLDEFMELMLEEDDFVRVLQSSLWNNGSSIGTKSARLMRKVMQYFVTQAKG